MTQLKKCRLLALGAAGLLLGSVSDSLAADGKLSYDHGTKMEFADFNMKANVQLQPRYSYEDIDVGSRNDAGFEVEGEDNSSFDLRRARLNLAGGYGEDVNWRLQNDFASSNGGSTMQDAWIRWNTDMMGITFGQYKQPFGREVRIGGENLYFTERSGLTNAMTMGRQQGVMASMTMAETGNFYASINNGESTGEGQNLPGSDNKVQAVFGLDWSSDNYGGRNLEGDFRDDKDSCGYTFGAAVAYGEGAVADAGDFDKTDINVDAGLRVAGFDMAGEWFWSESDFTDADVKPENTGFYISALYNLADDMWGIGGRFGFFEPDDAIEDFVGVDDVTEYSVVLNYFIDGHYLKLQNAVTWEVASPLDGDDIEDLRYDLQLSGYF